MSQSELYDYLIFRITGSFLNPFLGTLDCSPALLTRNSRGPSRTVLDFGLKGEIPLFCLVLWLVPLLSIGPSQTVDSVRDTQHRKNAYNTPILQAKGMQYAICIINAFHCVLTMFPAKSHVL